MISDNLMGIIVVTGVCVFLPVMIVWLVMLHKKNETNKRTEILLAAIEKNANIDTDGIAKMMTETTKKKSIKKGLLNRLLVGCILAFFGMALIVMAIVGWMNGSYDYDQLTGGITILSVGLAFLLNYFIGRRFLAKEIEREENNQEDEK